MASRARLKEQKNSSKCPWNPSTFRTDAALSYWSTSH
jgi:hypothetical protein